MTGVRYYLLGTAEVREGAHALLLSAAATAVRGPLPRTVPEQVAHPAGTALTPTRSSA